jgi:hypothetical protein
VSVPVRTLIDMTVVLALVPPARSNVLRTAPLRLAVFDCSVLSTDVIAATARLPLHSAFVEGMLEGTLRGFITHRVWAEVPRTLEDRWHESNGGFNLELAQRLWWQVYVPLLHTVETDRLPATPASRQLATEDPDDVGMLLLHAVIGPAALITCDPDLRRSGLVPEDWHHLRAAVWQVTEAEEQAQTANQIATIAVEGTARAVARTARAAWDHPAMALLIAAVLVGGFLIYRRTHPNPIPSEKIKPFLRDVGKAIVKQAAEVNQRFERGETVWADAERGSIGEELLHRVARVLACSPEPMTRSDILAAVPEFPGSTWFDRMYSLYELLRTYPMFCEIRPDRWQVGRAAVGTRFV